MTIELFFEALDTIENAKYNLDYTHSFKKSVKACHKSALDLKSLLEPITFLVQNGFLEDMYYPHPLKGFPRKKNRKVMECHISPDWLLVWVQDDDNLTLILFDTGTHSYLFNSKRLRKGKL
ncbi:MAG: type II toxin-antitoxin system YafQ family toxin [Lentimicrobiaceae bacterium]|nr:type II toxin-antitoxin system YafQ family toxin [Lentimicrobiaceae bacterium]